MKQANRFTKWTALLVLIWTQSSVADQLNIIYTGNLNGELEPCGCTMEGDLGGIRRQATVIDDLRKQDANLVLLSSGGLLSADIPSDKIKSRFILSGMQQLEYDAIGVQEHDLLFGVDFLIEHGLNIGLSLVASNTLPSPPFFRSQEIVRQDHRLIFFQWLDIENNTDMKPRSQQQIFKEQLSLRQALKQARKTGALTILATTRKLKRVKQSFPLPLVDILIIPTRADSYAEPQHIDNTLLLQPGARGMRLGKLSLQLEQGRIKNWQHEVIDLLQTVADAPRLQDWYDNYNAALKEDYQQRTRLKQQTEKSDSPYAGAQQCKACHSSEYSAWQKTRHADAYGSLLAVNKVFDPACIGCHSVGFGQAGGFLDASLTPQLTNVQCESCHGAARQHSLSAGKVKVTNSGWTKEKMCRQCHIGNHSPSFDLKTYWPRVSHRKGQGTSDEDGNSTIMPASKQGVTSRRVQ